MSQMKLMIHSIIGGKPNPRFEGLSSCATIEHTDLPVTSCPVSVQSCWALSTQNLWFAKLQSRIIKPQSNVPPLHPRPPVFILLFPPKQSIPFLIAVSFRVRFCWWLLHINPHELSIPTIQYWVRPLPLIRPAEFWRVSLGQWWLCQFGVSAEIRGPATGKRKRG